MPGKSHKKLPNTRAQVWMVGKDGRSTSRGGKKHEIFRYSEDHGVIINDGREVTKVDGRWYYRPR